MHFGGGCFGEFVAKSQFHKHIHTMHNRQYPEGLAYPCALHACTEARRPGALHAFYTEAQQPKQRTERDGSSVRWTPDSKSSSESS